MVDPLAIQLVAVELLAVWKLASTLYFDANVTPQFRAGAISGADPAVPAEMRVVQMKLPLPNLVVAALLSPDNLAQRVCEPKVARATPGLG